MSAMEFLARLFTASAMAVCTRCGSDYIATELREGLEIVEGSLGPDGVCSDCANLENREDG